MDKVKIIDDFLSNDDVDDLNLDLLEHYHGSRAIFQNELDNLKLFDKGKLRNLLLNNLHNHNNE